MARTRAPDFEDRQRQILRAAAVLFAEHGYNETLLDDIAERCGTKKSSLYHYYPSKDAILHELIAWKISDLTAKVEAAVEPMASPRARLDALATTLVEEYIRTPQEITVLLTQTRHLSVVALRDTAAIQNRIIDLVVGLLSELRPELTIPRRKSTVVAMLFFGMTNWIHVWYKPAGSIGPAELASMIVNVFLDGFVNQPASLLG
ncbi:TetR/AcrR family transcriptional regulator [Thauera sp. 2A1]|uniref:TetR/AcrR family transcriptional regulator n=1 Tax=Thauera sp. 2A1 TaxID=2570191 RepID=UPI001292BAF2|nr:TetR/AcrR family transcriptional regulator [Thauera sp. 2A1]KAI5912204.1 TetR/AcrR family transcriptional regulator [Thauera sp. 2A1]KAI5915028.1 TetR/AcrR family transcriptional regulator [Thauera sp. 2A1]